MDWDDLDPKKKTAQLRDLGTLDIEELRAYIAQLQTEIVRAEAAITAKEKVKSGAEALFKKA